MFQNILRGMGIVLASFIGEYAKFPPQIRRPHWAAEQGLHQVPMRILPGNKAALVAGF